jgi:hypothetical protein
MLITGRTNRKQPSSRQGYDPVSCTEKAVGPVLDRDGERKEGRLEMGSLVIGTRWEYRAQREATGRIYNSLCFDNDQVAIIFSNKLEIAFSNMLFSGSMSCDESILYPFL